jgi:hypothetical protein
LPGSKRKILDNRMSGSIMNKRNKELEKEMKAASKDPLFLEDTQKSMDSFKASDKETADMMHQW